MQLLILKLMLIETIPECPELNEELLTQLGQIYNHFTTRQGFPFSYCQRATIPVAKKTGLYVVGGYFRVDRETDAYGTRTLFPPHWWMEDRQATVIDLTLFQFNPWLNRPLPPNLIVVKETDSLYGRYVRSNSDKGKIRTY